ncbi:hypothetical protein ACEN2J_19780 [Pseudorhodobacter sp. W20_MBD10_FR17]|uniref:hypothetical protein n=1 Tax=Pseudorhodobacter sp. W20_MBD10_FR17 TaxID=3240266 RepID=UPI003F993834
MTAVDVTRRVVVAPGVEHVGVLYSGTGLREARNWLDAAFGRESTGPVVKPGLWILLLLAGIVVLFRPLAGFLPVGVPQRHTPQVSVRRFWAAVLLPAVVVPLVAVFVYRPFLPVLVADYLMIHLALYGAAQLAILQVWPLPRVVWVAALALVVWGLAVFGLAIDRYAASFVPTMQRLGIIAALMVGTVPFMLADCMVSVGGWRLAAVGGAADVSGIAGSGGVHGSGAAAVRADHPAGYRSVLSYPVAAGWRAKVVPGQRGWGLSLPGHLG